MSLFSEKWLPVQNILIEHTEMVSGRAITPYTKHNQKPK